MHAAVGNAGEGTGRKIRETNRNRKKIERGDLERRTVDIKSGSI